MWSLSWQITLIYRCKMWVHDQVQNLQHPWCPASDTPILLGTRNNFTFSGTPALLVKCYVLLQGPLHLWSQMAVSDLYFFFSGIQLGIAYVGLNFCSEGQPFENALCWTTFKMCHQEHMIPSPLGPTVVGQVLEEAWVPLEQPVSRCRAVAVVPELPYLKASKSAGLRVGMATTCS